ncbi:HlyD family secretion protein [Arcticibacterium luteifluviistationis]|uniref:HlyD family secretion protein n=1 Tax=Arcticibacterium luteifluviistationis TaxID=1784714 RepID=A0A2Z4GHZ2_9BACT|nr:HlyD family efflux transporter periplasmic adaptor subunit [Arcticibacterium luteifluviistationis]AWW00927.1 HlyD family secretion protein [Arcticibacterium luteifluviistationis]
MTGQHILKLTFLAAVIVGCSGGENDFDASGVFEAKEIIVSSESSGKILELVIEEGTVLTEGQIIGNIDCENLNLQKAQLEASYDAIGAKRNSSGPQVGILKQQLVTQNKQLAAQRQQYLVIEKEQKRLEKLVKAEAVPVKQLDDLNGNLEVLLKQIEAAESQLNVTKQQITSAEQQIAIGNRAVMSEEKPMQERIAQMENMIGKCQIQNPQAGTVLVKYAEQNEMTAPGKALYKLADMTELKLRAYLTNGQLAKVKVGQEVQVLIDNGEDGYKELKGVVEWISDKAEFTPKTIQTKDERANLVYATKIKVKNDGFLKIGMYGEVKL